MLRQQGRHSIQQEPWQLLVSTLQLEQAQPCLFLQREGVFGLELLFSPLEPEWGW